MGIHRQSSNLDTPRSPLSSPQLSSSALLLPSLPLPLFSLLSLAVALLLPLLSSSLVELESSPQLPFSEPKNFFWLVPFLLPMLTKALLRLEEFSVYQPKTILDHWTPGILFSMNSSKKYLSEGAIVKTC